jgi:ribose/xylose/arabinose/galactoside ABC-type transport system permease subunit
VRSNSQTVGKTFGATTLRLRRVLAHPQALVGVLLVLYVTSIALFVPEILSLQTASEVLVAMLPLAIAVIGQLFVLIIAQIDLSMTSVMAMGSVLSASIMTGEGGFLHGSMLAVPIAIIAFFVIAGLLGVANGMSTAWLGMPSFIVTLATMTLGSGVAVWYASFCTDSVSIGDLPDAFRVIGYGTVFHIPIALMLTAALVGVAYWVLRRTLFGRWLYAIGLNREAARISGVPVERVTIAAFIVSALCAALAAVIYTSRIETGTPVLAQNLLLDIVGAAVIGGVSLFGGRGTVTGALTGALFLTVLDKGLQLLGMSLFVVLAVKGGVILLAAVLDVAQRRWSRRQA